MVQLFASNPLARTVGRTSENQIARMYPEVFPGKSDQNNPEFVVYESLRSLPDSYIVFYSKRFMGSIFGKAECEIDFVIFNQRDVIVCLEVKGGLLHYDGVQDRWLQNGKVMVKAPMVKPPTQLVS